MATIFTYRKIDGNEFKELEHALKPVRIPIEQSPYWSAFDETVGRTYLGTFRYDDGDRLVAIASATLYRQKGRNWIWIKHGPIFASEPNTDVLKKMCSTLKAQFTEVNGVIPVFIRLNTKHKVGNLRAPFEHTMYDQTIILDLTKSEEQLLSDMSKSGRQGLRYAQRENLVVKEIAAENFSKFERELYPLISETGSRAGFGVHKASVYKNMLESLSPFAHLYAAYVKEEPVAWTIVVQYQDYALYYYAASNELGRTVQAPYILQWEVMKTLKSNGIKQYDLMGIASKNFPELANVTTFKQKFSKEITDVTPTYDLPLQPLKYRALSLAVKLKRSFRR